MGQMTLAQTVHQLKKSTKLLINSTKANLTLKIRYAVEKVPWKSKVVHHFQISWPGINNKFKLVIVFVLAKLN